MSSPKSRQTVLFAEMMEDTDPQEKKRAHRLCGSSSIYNAKGGVRLYCGRRDCPYCYKRRYQKIRVRIQRFVQNRKDAGQSCTLHWQKITASQHLVMTRSIRSQGGEYMCFPVAGDQEYVISDVITGTPVHVDAFRLDRDLKVWARTPQGRRISSSNGFVIPHAPQKKKKLPTYLAHTALPNIVPRVEAVGGTVIHATKSYAVWDVDAQKLTHKLMQDDIWAYQLTIPEGAQLSENLQDAERELGLEPGTISREDWDRLLAAKRRYQSIALNKRGRPVTEGPVELFHSNNLHGITRQSFAPTASQRASPP